MKKLKFLVLVLVAFMILPVVANAEKYFDAKSGILYGGTLDDTLSDIDFFSDGSYVVVGNTKSTYREITNLDEPKTMGVIAIYDKDNTLVHEYNYDSIAYSVAPGGTTLSQVLVLDDSSFIVCGNHSSSAFCAKVTTSGERVWNTPLAASVQGIGLKIDKNSMEIIKTSDNHILVMNYTTNNEIYKIDLDGNVVYTIDSLNVNSLIETDDYYVLGGNESDKAVLYLINKNDGTVADTIYTAIPSVEVSDIEKITDGYIVTTRLSLGGHSKLVVIDVADEGNKEYELGYPAYNTEAMLLSDGNVLVIATKSDTPSSSYVIMLDSNLNAISQKEFKFEQEFSIHDVAISPVNNNFYFVGQTKAALNGQTNMGGTDGFIMSYAFAEPTPASDVNENTSSEEDIKNPNTGMFISLIVTSSFLTLIIGAIIVIKKKNKLYKI